MTPRKPVIGEEKARVDEHGAEGPQVLDVPDPAGLDGASQIIHAPSPAPDSELRTEVEMLRRQLSLLTARLETTRTLDTPDQNSELRESSSSSSHANPPSTSLWVAKPDRFDGATNDVRGFINQTRLFIRCRETLSTTEAEKVNVLLSLLSGKARNWAAPYIERRDPITNDFERFVSRFEEAFGDGDRMAKAAFRLRALRQASGPASAYAATFQQCALDSEWNDAALVSQFVAGLRDECRIYSSTSRNRTPCRKPSRWL